MLAKDLKTCAGLHVLKLNSNVSKDEYKNLCKIMYYIYSTRYVLAVWQ
jgi:hypothetical protein